MNIPPVSSNPPDNDSVITQIDSFIAGLNVPPGTTIGTSVVTKTVAVSAQPEPTNIVPPSSDEEMAAFVLKHSAQLAESSVKSIMQLQTMAVATGDSDLIESLAALITASTGAIETVNKIHLQNKKVNAAKELRKIDLEGKKEIQLLKNVGYLNLPAGNTNILVATREEIMEQLTGKARAKSAGDVYELSSSERIIPLKDQTTLSSTLSA